MGTALPETTAPEGAPGGAGLTAQDWRVFGTGARMVLPAGADIGAARQEADRELAAIDLAASRFRDDSEISRLNRAGGRRVMVSELFAELIGVALDAAASTDGAVDPTLGAVLQDLGYDRTFREVPQDGPAVALTVRWLAGWQLVELDRAAGTVRLPDGVQLDLGATAKAHASDRAAAAAHRATGGPVLVGLGGDIAVTGQPPAGGWPVAVAEDSGAPLGAGRPVVVITEGGVATSSTTVRHWRRGDDLVHHLLDPWTGRPTQGPWRTVTVAASSCLEANVAATAAIVLGDGATGWLGDRGLAARLVSRTGVARVLPGWPVESR